LRLGLKYYFSALLLVLAIEFIPVLLSLLLSEGFGVILSFLIFILKYVMIAVVVILQVVVFSTNLSRREVNLKFLSAFTCVYSLDFIITYTSRTMHVLQLENLLAPLQAGNPEIFEPHQSAYIGSHLWFLLPVLLQAIIFILFAMKKPPVSETIS
jgi:hypothetical protein